MTPPQAAQEKPTSPRAICGCACGCCEIMHPEREAAAATPSLDVERLRDAVIRVVGVEIDLIDAAEIAELARLDEGSATPDQDKGEPR